jgi:hypothetical protein
MKKRITSFKVVREVDENPDLSWIGTYSDKPESDLAIETNGGPRAFAWFNPQPGACETKERAQADYKRMCAYNDGHWHMQGIKCVAVVATSEDGRTWLMNELSSGGLYGIESDCSDADLGEILAEQRDELSAVLRAFGFTPAAIEDAINA